MRFRAILTAVAVISIAVDANAASPTANLIRDDFTPDTVHGGFVGWDFTRAQAVLLPERSPAGKPVVRITGGADGFALTLSTLPFRLVRGSDFRMSVKVRTHKLAGIRRREFQFCNYCWQEAKACTLPADTKGQWVEAACEGRVFASSDGSYKCWFYLTEPIPEGGWLDVAEPTLTGQVPADGKPVAAWDAGENRPRIVPIDPLLSKLDADSARMRFYFPGAAPAGCRRRIVRAQLGGRVAEADLDAEGEAQLEFGAVTPGWQTLAVQLIDADRGTVLAANSYRARARKAVTAPTPARRLNNFVSELKAGRTGEGRYEFVLKDDGWVYVRLDGVAEGASARLDGVALVPPRPGDPYEAFRYLEAGRHELCFDSLAVGSPEGRYTVRLVKEIIRSSLNRAWKMRRNFADYYYGCEFHAELGLLTGFNSISCSVQKWNEGFLSSDFAKQTMAEFAQRGIQLTSSFGLGAADSRRRYLDEVWRCISDRDAYRSGAHLEYDEAAIGYRDSVVAKWNTAEAWWRAFAEGRGISVFMEDGPMGVYRSRSADLPELSAFVNSGDGRGMILSEAYYRTPETEAGVQTTVEFLKRQLKSMRELVPEAPRHFVYGMNGWMSVGGWTTWIYPAMDICAFNSRIMQALATDPEFAEIGGMGFTSPCCNEEFYRFVISALRYYCIEGETEDFAALQGIALYPHTVENGDFAEGFANWTACPAAEGTLKLGHLDGLGLRCQKRQFMPYYLKIAGKQPGDDFALFTGSAKGPNRLRQQVRGLKPGRVYVLNYVTSDHEQAQYALGLKGGVKPPVRESPTLVARLRGVEEISELEFVRSDMGKYGKGLVFACRKVFRALAETAELEFSDWKAENAPGGAVDQAWLLNYVGVYPYFLRSEADLEVLKRLTLEARVAF